jgi:hypothetical protein
MLVALAALVSPAAAQAQGGGSQAFFTAKLLEDRRTIAPIKDLLRTGGFVDRRVVFRDVTGDGRSDAVVRVQSGGAAGVVAVYVFSTHGAGELRAVFRAQRLMRASTRIARGRLAVSYARYGPTDPLSAPARIDEARLRWDRRRKRLVVAQRVRVHPPPDDTSGA